jgi:hypothetical protein
MAKNKEVILSVYESELAFDLLIRAEKIFKHIRRQSGVELNTEVAIKWQKAYEHLIISQAEFLEGIAVDIGKPELYTDSTYISILKNKYLSNLA